jgi:hypothetical protein
MEQEVEPVHTALQQAREPSWEEEQEGQQPMQQAEEQRVQVASTEGPPGRRGLQSALVRTLLNQTRGLVEQQAEQWLHSLLDAVFSESLRTTLQQQAEQRLRLLLQTGLEAIPGDSAVRELQQEVEQTLEPLLQEAFDALFAGPVRAEVQGHGERVIQALLHGDFEAAGQHAEQVLQSSLHGALAVLEHHAEQVEQLLLIILKVLFKASQGALGSLLKETLGTIATVLSESAEETVPRNVQETGAASRERMAGAKQSSVTTCRSR